jgi:hypothetical protein
MRAGKRKGMKRREGKRNWRTYRGRKEEGKEKGRGAI